MAELGLARGTVESAYGLLAAEGYILARGQAGTIVAPDLKPQQLSIEPGLRTPFSEPQLSFRPESTMPFQMGLPALDAFPRKIWARLGARAVRSMQPADMAHPSIFGLPSLREEIAAYLQVSRGVTCGPHQVFITSGYRNSLSLIAQALLKPGDRVWTEDPGYPPTRELLSGLQMKAVPVPVDADGIVVAAGVGRAIKARAAVVTPAHQSPMGVSLSLPRRQALLDWASRQGAWVIEDDYDGEYRYVSRPLPALKSLDRDGRVLYAGTFSKMLFPSIRLAYVVVPEAVVECFEQTAGRFNGGSPQLTQAIVSGFIAEGHFSRHIQRMRRLYGDRRAMAVHAFESALNGLAGIHVQPGGMHLILQLRGRRSDRRLVERMKKAGLYGEALSDWRAEGDGVNAVLIGFTNIETERAAFALASRLRQIMD